MLWQAGLEPNIAVSRLLSYKLSFLIAGDGVYASIKLTAPAPEPGWASSSRGFTPGYLYTAPTGLVMCKFLIPPKNFNILFTSVFILISHISRLKSHNSLIIHNS
jgi:hypothetical protein